MNSPSADDACSCFPRIKNSPSTPPILSRTAVYMVRDFQAAAGDAASEQAVGRATGMLAATFCAAQLVTSYPWGMVSDRVGRKVSTAGVS